MPMPACRLYDICTGHPCWPPRPNNEGSPNILINGRPAHRQDDSWSSHCCITCHHGELQSGSPTVIFNDKQQGRIGDPVNCGSYVQEGSLNVIIGP